MKSVSKLGLLVILSGMLGACASLERLEKKLFRNSTLHNLNPAPESMAPETAGVEGKDAVVDPTYLRSQADYHYTLGEAVSLEGDSERAIEEFKLTLVYDPGSADVRLRLAAEYVKQGLLSEAIEQSELAVKANPKSKEGLLLLGGLYSSLKMYELAMSQYQEIMRIYPNDIEVPTYIGALLAEQKKYEEAETHFQALAKNPKNKNPYMAYYYIGRIREERGEAFFKSAERAYVKSISMKPGAEEPVMGLAKLYGRQKQEKQELQLLQSFQDKFGPNRKAAQRLSMIYLENEDYMKAYKELELLEGFEPDNLNVKVRIALVLIEEKNYKAAVYKLEEILLIAPDLDKIRFYLGGVYEELKDHPSAIKQFAKIPSTSQYYAEALIHVAHLNKLEGDSDRAIEVLQAGIKERDDIPQFYAYYASLLDEKRAYNSAIKMLRGAVKKFPKHAQLRFFLGSMYDRVGKKDQTVKQMEKVLEADEHHIQALNYLAYTYAELNENLDRAQTMAAKALELNPHDGYILDTMGWVLFKQNRVEEAIKYLEAAYKNKSTESIVAEHLGDAYYRHQLIDKAKKMYQKAVAIEKDEEKLKELRTKIVSIEQQQARRLDSKRQPASKPGKK